MSVITNYQPYITAETVKLATFLNSKITSLDNTPTEQNIIFWLNEYVSSLSTPLVTLSNVRPNFEAIKQQFHAILANQDSWKDIIQAGGGETLLEFISAIGSLGQDGIITALQENNLDSAVLTTSIYTLMRMLGVHIRRRIPAYVDVLLKQTVGQMVYVPTLSQFIIDGQGYFNRQAIVINSNEASKTIRLYQGAISMEEYISTGLPYQRFELGSTEYDIADTDIYCFLEDGTEFKRIEDGLWNHSGTENCFYENSLPEGTVEVLMGNNLYGAMVPINKKIRFVYAKTNGALQNSTQTGKVVAPVALNIWVPDRIKRDTTEETNNYSNLVLNNISGVTTTPITGGAKEKDKDHYRAVGPFLNSGKKGMIRRNDHFAVGLEYPGVVDILFQGQKEIAPYNRNFINVVYVTPVMDGGRAMTDLEWVDFEEYLNSRAIWRLDWIHKKPTRLDLDIQAILYVSLETDTQGVASYAEYNLRNSYGLRRGSLGYTLSQNDIHDKLKINYKNLKVDYIDLIAPNTDTVPNKTEYVFINKVTLQVLPTKRNYIPYNPPRTEDTNQ